MYIFDELALRNAFIGDIKSIYNKYYDYLKCEVDVIASNSQQPSYPCVVVSLINPRSAERYDDNDGSYRFVDVSLDCEINTKELQDYSLEDSVIVLKQLLQGELTNKYKTLVVTRDSDAPSVIDDTKRRIVTFRFTYDNKNKVIYSN